MLTIVIPYYKISFFETTLKSLSSQTNKNFKVVIGDDASPNNPLQLLEKYKDDFDFIYKRFDSNLGSMSLVNQWNRCLEINTLSQWTMILGDDDVLDPNVVQAFYDTILNFDWKKYFAIDQHYLALQRQLSHNIYTVLPLVANQRPSHSSITQQYENYQDVLINSYTKWINEI